MAKNIVFIDLETGGLDPALHQITQIAALAVECGAENDAGGQQLIAGDEPFERKIKLVPGKWAQEALDKQNFSIPVWDEEAVPITEALGDLHKWAEPFADDRISNAGNPYRAVDVAGHNIEFDAKFLNASAKRCGVRLPLALWTGGMLDTLQLAKWVAVKEGKAPKNFQLATLCKERGIVDFRAHDACEDVMACIRLAQSLMAGF